MIISCLIWFCTVWSSVLAYSYEQFPQIPRQPYCALNRLCCVSRDDDCYRPILGTRCYCDEFCDQGHDDCCPDYNEVCRGIHLPPTPPIITCSYEDRTYYIGHTYSNGCSLCTCTNTGRFQCVYDDCLMSPAIVTGINSASTECGHTTWRARVYEMFQGRKLKDGLINCLGTLNYERHNTRYVYEAPYHGMMTMPSHFDARERWPGYITSVYNQNWCGRDWAVVTANVATDRCAILSKGAPNVILSPDTLISCNIPSASACSGGYVDRGWEYVRTHGLINSQCSPYNAVSDRCPYQRRGFLPYHDCLPSENQCTRYTIGNMATIHTEAHIMHEIYTHGPVHATMRVYQDFFHYWSGVYRHTRCGNTQMYGQHSVRIVGWGEDGRDKYWIVANSWGREWGEDGYFKIVRGQNECQIESYVMAPHCEISTTC